MPDQTRSKAAAEEIVRCTVIACGVCGDCRYAEGPIDPSHKETVARFSAIIDRHYGEMEKVLRVAAKWAAMQYACPVRYGASCQHSNPRCRPIDEHSSPANCWIEYWKKEAEGCATEAGGQTTSDSL